MYETRLPLPGAALALTLIAGSALVFPVTVQGAGESCRTGPCHRDIGREAVVHEPVRKENCGDCHLGSTPGHPESEGEEFVFAGGGPPGTCRACHDVEGGEAGAAALHAPVREGRCLACHGAHGAPYSGMLNGRYPADTGKGNPRRLPFETELYSLCWDCHDVYLAIMSKTSTKTRFRKGAVNLHFTHVSGEKGYACGACHPTHRGGERLIGRDAEWTEDMVKFRSLEGGGTCTPGCHGPRAYFRGVSGR